MNDQAFDWQLPGKIVVVDNNGELMMQNGFDALMALGTFAVVAFDPASRIKKPERFENLTDVQLYRHAMLGSGGPGKLYVYLDPELTSTLPLRALEELPTAKRHGAKAITQLPINTVALDSIQGLECLDWLILSDNADSAKILEHGHKTLSETLLIQARVAFQPSHQSQPDLMQISHWAVQHGFRFYRLNTLNYYSDLPDTPNIINRQATELEAANALFVPSRERMLQLSEGQLSKLSFLLHTVYNAHDLAYEVLQHISQSLADEYIVAEGLGVASNNEPLYADTENIGLTSAELMGGFSAAQQQWWATDPSDSLLDTLVEPDSFQEDESTSLSGDLEADLETLRERYPLAGSPLREMSYLIELLDSLEERQRFEEGYQLIDKAIEDGLSSPEQVEIIIYWRKKQLNMQGGRWLPSEIELPEIPWHVQGEKAAKQEGSDVSQAIILRRMGGVSQAQTWLAGYQKVKPDCPLAFAEQALLKLMEGEAVKADEVVEKLKHHEANPGVSQCLAFWLLEAKKPSKSLSIINRLTSDSPEDSILKAKIFLQQERWDLAEQQLNKVSYTEPGAHEALNVKADKLNRDGQHGASVATRVRAICHTPTYSNTWERLSRQAINSKRLYPVLADMLETIMRSGQGSIDVIRQLVELYFKHEAWESATRWAEEVLKISPEMVSLRVNAIEAYRKQKDWTAVRLHAVEGVRRYPEKFVFSYYLGMVENNLGHAEKALKYLEMCYKKTPKDSRIGYEYARALVDTHQYEKAKRVINTVDQSQLAIPALVVIASICTRIGDFQKSITLHREILAKEPDNPDMHWSLANALLKAGMPGEGWDEYEWGFKANQRNPQRTFNVPLWNGEELTKDKKLLVWYEQGLGDEIMFAACLTNFDTPDCNIIFQCRERLGKLFKKTFSHIEIWPLEESKPLPKKEAKDVAYHVPLGTLMRFLHRECGVLPNYSGYLKCDLSRVEYWRNYLEKKFGQDKKFVGVSWSGGITTLKKAKTYFGTRKELFKPILEVKGVVFISLMYFDVESDLLELRDEGGFSVYSMPDVDMKNDLDEVSAITKALDLVIATENFPAMHAGTLGVECWLIGNCTAHYYMDSDSYLKLSPSIKIDRIERPESRRHIEGVVRKVSKRLENRVNS